MSNSPELEQKHADNRQERLEFIKEWADYVRTHPDDVWGPQVNKLVNSQLESARHFEDERPDMDELRESPLLNRNGDDDATDD
ncbi:hypothetical protein [Halorussus halophilus]|uniref:hypothetical protein n=1 Tax=Halorussus halophilus TaxID=2650975 RepID=UPI00130174FF|nr:hypothetical protein [Halorussus halophilus]